MLNIQPLHYAIVQADFQIAKCAIIRAVQSAGYANDSKGMLC